MNSKPILQTLPLECLLEILQYVPLPECMFLRSSSSHLKSAVDEHFRTGVRTLPVLLSACYSPLKHQNQVGNYEKITFGSASGVMQRNIYENIYSKSKYRLVDVYRPRGENYLVLTDLAKFDAFMNFIAKYLPGITELELVIDHNDHLENIPAVLNLYREQLKVLLLEQTTRSLEKHKNKLAFEFLRSIESLDKLEKLFFFSKWTESINQIFPDIHRCLYNWKLPSLNKTFRKLKVLHFPDFELLKEYYVTSVYSHLEELGVGTVSHPKAFIPAMGPSFPKLEKLIVFRSSEIEKLEAKLMLNLKTFYVCDPQQSIGLEERIMSKLDELMSLEELYY